MSDLAAPQSPPAENYYAKGSVELAVETPVMMKRLEKRRRMTVTSERLLIVLCGLPARGKSFLARKLLNYLCWRGNKVRVFNVGKYRRQACTELLKHDQYDHFEDDANGTRHKVGSCDANFFDDDNQLAAEIRQRAAEVALKDTLEWLEEAGDSTESGEVDDTEMEDEENSGLLGDNFFYGHLSHSSRRQYHRIAIFDATNSTKKRRDWILEQCDLATEASGNETGVVFVESICDDQELLEENFMVKISTCPDFAGMSQEAALQDLTERCQKYESRYEPLEVNSPLSYIKIFNLSSRLMVNHIYGRLAKVVVPALMAWNTGSQPIFLCRAGETEAMRSYMNTLQQSEGATTTTASPPRMRLRGDRLGEGGLRFRDALCDFIEKEGMEFMEDKKKRSYHDHHPSKNDTGTSISGLRHQRVPNSFPCLVMSSTMPRALETASWPRLPFPIKDVSNLNPLDMGDFAGMDLEGIREKHPEWYTQLEREPFHTRFSGGESYSDLINRLESVVIDMEQQLGPTVVVSHVSVLQVLVAYFRATPVAECTQIEIPMHTVLKFVPLRGGGWLESHHKLVEDEAEPPPQVDQQGEQQPPVWGDSSSCLPARLSKSNLLAMDDEEGATA